MTQQRERVDPRTDPAVRFAVLEIVSAPELAEDLEQRVDHPDQSSHTQRVLRATRGGGIWRETPEPGWSERRCALRVLFRRLPIPVTADAISDQGSSVRTVCRSVSVVGCSSTRMAPASPPPKDSIELAKRIDNGPPNGWRSRTSKRAPGMIRCSAR